MVQAKVSQSMYGLCILPHKMLASFFGSMMYTCFFMISSIPIRVWYHQHIEAETKWPPFCRWPIQVHFSWMKMHKFWIKFHWSLFLRVQLTHWDQVRQNGRRLPDDIFKCIFSNKNISISIKISLKFVPKGSINNIPALVQIMAWRLPGDKSLCEPMMVSLLTHTCVTRPQWVDNIPTLVQIMAWCQPGNKPSSEPTIIRLLTHICVTQHQWVNLAQSNLLWSLIGKILTKTHYW